MMVPEAGKRIEEVNLIVKTHIDKQRQLQVHCKKFEVKPFFLNERDEKGLQTAITDFLGDFLEKNKKVKIVSILSPIPNIYSLCVLTTLSQLLLELKNAKKKKFEDVLKQLEFVMLVTQIVHGSYLAKTFLKHNKEIIDFDKKLKLGTKIVLPFTQSLFNVMIREMNLNNAKTTNEIFKKMKYQEIDSKFIEEMPTLKSGLEKKLEKIKRTKDYKFENEKEEKNTLHKRSRNILFETNLIYDLLRVFKKYLEESKKNDIKIILILAEPIKLIINDIKDLISTDTSNIMVIYYSDPVHQKDPDGIMEHIPSYLTPLSPYYNSELVSHGMDEYYHISMLTHFDNNMFVVPSELRDVLNKEAKDYGNYKRPYIQELRGESVDLIKTLERYKKIYVEKQKKILEMETKGFLSVQDATLDHLKFLL